MRRLRAALTASPAVVPALAAVVVLLVWAGEDAGYPPTAWYPGTLVLLLALVLTVATVPLRAGDLPRPVAVALVALALFTAWSLLSITWADDRGEAWDGANRTLLYLVVFALFATWPLRPGAGALVLGVWAGGMIAIAVGVLLGLPGDDPFGAFSGERLEAPAGYPNAAAAQWLIALWPALALAARPEVPWWARGALAGGAVVLADLALLSLSRGAVFSVPLVAALLVLTAPGRVRALLTALPVAIAVGLTADAVLDVGEGIAACAPEGQTERGLCTLTPGLVESLVDEAKAPILLTALGVAALIGAAAAVEAIRPPRGRMAERLGRWVGVVATGVTGAVIVVALVIGGGPVKIAGDAWDSFRSEYEGGEPGARLSEGLGSNRSDIYRVALVRFRDEPVTGVGADNFRQDYLLLREDPRTTARYPHSVELRALSQTGVIGAALLLAAIVAACVAAAGALRRAPPLGAAVAGGGLAGFAYWLVHGSFDWFWEFAGLGGAAWALLGLACALAPRRGERPPPRRPSPRVVLPVVALALLAAPSLLLPYLAAREASRSAMEPPEEAFRRLDRAADLNPLSDKPLLAAGTLAVRAGDLPRARRAFGRALERNPRSAYASFELGAIASEEGRRREALVMLDRTLALNPLDVIAREARADVRRGQRLDVRELNARLRERDRMATE